MLNCDRDSSHDAPSTVTPSSVPVTVSYDTHSDNVTHRQFRVLLILTTINTILLGGVIAGPVLVPYLREQWTQYQQRRQARLAEQQRFEQMRKHFAAALATPIPPETVMYTEDPEEAKVLLASDPDWRTVRTRAPNRSGREWQTWQSAAFRDAPEDWKQLMALHNRSLAPARPAREQGAVLLLFYEMTDRNNQKRLIEVTLDVEEMESSMMWSSSGGAFNRIRARRTLYARALDPALLLRGQPQNPQNYFEFTLHIGTGNDLNSPAAPQANARIALDPALVTTPAFRFYAGQPDPADPRRFTIAYELNGRLGAIEGHVLDDGRVVLEPREGEVLSRGRAAAVWIR